MKKYYDQNFANAVITNLEDSHHIQENKYCLLTTINPQNHQVEVELCVMGEIIKQTERLFCVFYVF